MMIEKSGRVHKFQFYKLKNRAINCICLQRENKELALSRSDHSVEIWNVVHTPYLQKWIPGPTSASVEDLTWCGNRLMSCGQQCTVVEYDLVNETIKGSTSVTGGVAWCLDYCPKTNLVAVGTEDGFINVFTVTDEGLEFFKFMDKQQGRILCMSWDASGQYLVTGSSDTVRIWSLTTGHAAHKLATGRSQRNRETIVWSVAVTSDLTIISGDSRGILSFWDGKLGTQVDSFHSHAADILSIALSEDESTLFCSGVDPAMIMFGRVVDGNRLKRRWAKGAVRRIHDHDVRALAMVGNSGLYSGGVDGYLAFNSYQPRARIKFPPLLKGSSAQILSKKRMLLLRQLNKVELWKLGTPADGADADLESTLPLTSNPANLASITSAHNEQIVCAGVSEDGRFVAFSTTLVLKFFMLNLKETSVVRLPGTIDCGPCKFMAFYKAKKKQLCAVVTQNNQIRILQMNDDGPEELHSFSPSDGSLISDCISHLTVSAAGDLLAIADCSSHVCAWSTADFSLVATLPTYESVPTAVAISRDSSSILVAYADHQLVEYEVARKQYSAFSKRVQNQMKGVCPSTISNIFFDHRYPDSVLLHDNEIFCGMFKDEVEEGVAPVKSRRRDSAPSEKESSTAANTFHPLKFKHLVHAGWLEGDEMVIVELPPATLWEGLPPVLEQKKFGTK